VGEKSELSTTVNRWTVSGAAIGHGG